MNHPRTDQSEATQSETPSSEAMRTGDWGNFFSGLTAPAETKLQNRRAEREMLLRTIDPAGLARHMANRAQRFFEGVNPDDIVLMFTLWILMYEENADAS